MLFTLDFSHTLLQRPGNKSSSS